MTGRLGFDDLGGADLRDRAVRAQFADPLGAASYAALYRSGGPSERYFSSRLHAVSMALRGCAGGSLLDAGCGPGMFVEQVLRMRPGDFRVTALDQSPAMIAEVARRTDGADVRLTEPVDVVHYDVTAVVPPMDRALWRRARGWRERPDRTVSRGARRWLGSAYLVSARRR